MTEKKIGVLIGREWSWPPAFIGEINRRNAGVSAELVKLGGTRLAEPCVYSLIVDRISYRIPYYRTYLKTAVLSGTTVINNPLWSSAYDRFFNASLVTRMGFRHPRAIALPSHTYQEGIAEEALRNLHYPVPWEEHIEYLGGFPVVLRPVHESDMRHVYVLESFEELWLSYDKTGTEPMMLREHITWDKYVRCICIGQERILPIKYSPGVNWSTRYHYQPNYLSPEEKELVIESAARINQALGFDINAIDFAFKKGELYTVDVTNPTPDFDVNTLTPYFFDWVVKSMADHVITLLRGQRLQLHEFSWGKQIHSLPSVSNGVNGTTRELIGYRR